MYTISQVNISFAFGHKMCARQTGTRGDAATFERMKHTLYMNLNAHTCSVHLLANKFWQHITYSAWTGNALHVLALLWRSVDDSWQIRKKKTNSYPIEFRLMTFYSIFFLSFSLTVSFAIEKCVAIYFPIKWHSNYFASDVNEMYDISRLSISTTQLTTKRAYFCQKYCDIKSQLSRISKKKAISSRFNNRLFNSAWNAAITCMKILWLPLKSVLNALKTMHSYYSPIEWRKKNSSPKSVNCS